MQCNGDHCLPDVEWDLLGPMSLKNLKIISGSCLLELWKILPFLCNGGFCGVKFVHVNENLFIPLLLLLYV